MRHVIAKMMKCTCLWKARDLEVTRTVENDSESIKEGNDAFE